VQFEQAMLPHLDAAHNLARWLTRNDADAADVVQESYVRALNYFDGFRGGDARAWLLRIVRNTCYTWLRQNRRSELETSFDETIHSAPAAVLRLDPAMLRQAIEELPAEYREALVLREIEGLPYKEIAHVADIPLGTVMSRLARARQLLRSRVVGKETTP
jgi:RNA polymerase sigma-70 factor (ECF subfamily)